MSCGSDYPMVHCHNRNHMNHTMRGEWIDYNHTVRGPCMNGHAHPYEDTEHLNDPQH